MSTGAKFAIAFLIVVMSACNQTLNIPTEQITTVTPFPISPTWTPSPVQTAETIPSAPLIFTPTPTSTLTPTLSSPRHWFIIPESSASDSSNTLNIKLFKGIKFPPLPDNVIQEFGAIIPYGEVPSWTIIYQIFVMRQGNERMLWLGVPFEEGSQSWIYDVIPLPPTQAGDVLIPFTCIHNNEYDLFLIVIAAYPEEGGSATDIHYAWRIDQSSTTLQPVTYRDVFCPRDY